MGRKCRYKFGAKLPKDRTEKWSHNSKGEEVIVAKQKDIPRDRAGARGFSLQEGEYLGGAVR